MESMIIIIYIPDNLHYFTLLKTKKNTLEYPPQIFETPHFICLKLKGLDVPVPGEVPKKKLLDYYLLHMSFVTVKLRYRVDLLIL